MAWLPSPSSFPTAHPHFPGLSWCRFGRASILKGIASPRSPAKPPGQPLLPDNLVEARHQLEVALRTIGGLEERVKALYRAEQEARQEAEEARTRARQEAEARDADLAAMASRLEELERSVAEAREQGAAAAAAVAVRTPGAGPRDQVEGSERAGSSGASSSGAGFLPPISEQSAMARERRRAQAAAEAERLEAEKAARLAQALVLTNRRGAGPTAPAARSGKPAHATAARPSSASGAVRGIISGGAWGDASK